VVTVSDRDSLTMTTVTRSDRDSLIVTVGHCE